MDIVLTQATLYTIKLKSKTEERKLKLVVEQRELLGKK